VGDSITDVEAGLAADIWTIGYANKPGKDEALRDAGADAVLDSMACPGDRVAARRDSQALSRIVGRASLLAAATLRT
jgi:phosphoglycolate phosphatase